MAKRPGTDAIVRALGFIQRPIQAEYGPSACILATRVAVDVLRAHGVRVQPVAVHVEVFNPAYVEHIERGEHEAIETDPRCWSAQLGFTGEEQGDDRVDMHVVAVVEDRLLLDLTLDQCSRPEHDVVLTPGIFEGLSPEFARGEPKSYPVHGCSVVYEAHPEEKGFLASPYWTESAVRQPFVDATLARLRAGGWQEENARPRR